MQISLRSLLSLAWPIVLARSAQAVIGFCDALMTAPLGESAVRAACKHLGQKPLSMPRSRQ